MEDEEDCYTEDFEDAAADAPPATPGEGKPAAPDEAELSPDDTLGSYGNSTPLREPVKPPVSEADGKSGPSPKNTTGDGKQTDPSGPGAAGAKACTPKYSGGEEPEDYEEAEEPAAEEAEQPGEADEDAEESEDEEPEGAAARSSARGLDTAAGKVQSNAQGLAQSNECTADGLHANAQYQSNERGLATAADESQPIRQEQALRSNAWGHQTAAANPPPNAYTPPLDTRAAAAAAAELQTPPPAAAALCPPAAPSDTASSVSPRPLQQKSAWVAATCAAARPPQAFPTVAPPGDPAAAGAGTLEVSVKASRCVAESFGAPLASLRCNLEYNGAVRVLPLPGDSGVAAGGWVGSGDGGAAAAFGNVEKHVGRVRVSVIRVHDKVQRQTSSASAVSSVECGQGDELLCEGEFAVGALPWVAPGSRDKSVHSHTGWVPVCPSRDGKLFITWRHWLPCPTSVHVRLAFSRARNIALPAGSRAPPAVSARRTAGEKTRFFVGGRAGAPPAEDALAGREAGPVVKVVHGGSSAVFQVSCTGKAELRGVPSGGRVRGCKEYFLWGEYQTRVDTDVDPEIHVTVWSPDGQCCGEFSVDALGFSGDSAVVESGDEGTELQAGQRAVWRSLRPPGVGRAGTLLLEAAQMLPTCLSAAKRSQGAVSALLAAAASPARFAPAFDAAWRASAVSAAALANFASRLAAAVDACFKTTHPLPDWIQTFPATYKPTPTPFFRFRPSQPGPARVNPASSMQRAVRTLYTALSTALERSAAEGTDRERYPNTDRVAHELRAGVRGEFGSPTGAPLHWLYKVVSAAVREACLPGPRKPVERKEILHPLAALLLSGQSVPTRIEIRDRASPAFSARGSPRTPGNLSETFEILIFDGYGRDVTDHWSRFVEVFLLSADSGTPTGVCTPRAIVARAPGEYYIAARLKPWHSALQSMAGVQEDVVAASPVFTVAASAPERAELSAPKSWHLGKPARFPSPRDCVLVGYDAHGNQSSVAVASVTFPPAFSDNPGAISGEFRVDLTTGIPSLPFVDARVLFHQDPAALLLSVSVPPCKVPSSVGVVYSVTATVADAFDTRCPASCYDGKWVVLYGRDLARDLARSPAFASPASPSRSLRPGGILGPSAGLFFAAKAQLVAGAARFEAFVPAGAVSRCVCPAFHAAVFSSEPLLPSGRSFSREPAGTGAGGGAVELCADHSVESGTLRVDALFERPPGCAKRAIRLLPDEPVVVTLHGRGVSVQPEAGGGNLTVLNGYNPSAVLNIESLVREAYADLAAARENTFPKSSNSAGKSRNSSGYGDGEVRKESASAGKPKRKAGKSMTADEKKKKNKKNTGKKRSAPEKAGACTHSGAAEEIDFASENGELDGEAERLSKDSDEGSKSDGVDKNGERTGSIKDDEAEEGDEPRPIADYQANSAVTVEENSLYSIAGAQRQALYSAAFTCLHADPATPYPHNDTSMFTIALPRETETGSLALTIELPSRGLKTTLDITSPARTGEDSRETSYLPHLCTNAVRMRMTFGAEAALWRYLSVSPTEDSWVTGSLGDEDGDSSSPSHRYTPKTLTVSGLSVEVRGPALISPSARTLRAVVRRASTARDRGSSEELATTAVVQGRADFPAFEVEGVADKWPLRLAVEIAGEDGDEGDAGHVVFPSCFVDVWKGRHRVRDAPALQLEVQGLGNEGKSGSVEIEACWVNDVLEALDKSERELQMKAEKSGSSPAVTVNCSERAHLVSNMSSDNAASFSLAVSPRSHRVLSSSVPRLPTNTLVTSISTLSSPPQYNILEALPAAIAAASPFTVRYLEETRRHPPKAAVSILPFPPAPGATPVFSETVTLERNSPRCERTVMFPHSSSSVFHVPLSLADPGVYCCRVTADGGLHVVSDPFFIGDVKDLLDSDAGGAFRSSTSIVASWEKGDLRQAAVESGGSLAFTFHCRGIQQEDISGSVVLQLRAAGEDSRDGDDDVPRPGSECATRLTFKRTGACAAVLPAPSEPGRYQLTARFWPSGNHEVEPVVLFGPHAGDQAHGLLNKVIVDVVSSLDPTEDPRGAMVRVEPLNYPSFPTPQPCVFTVVDSTNRPIPSASGQSIAYCCNDVSRSSNDMEDPPHTIASTTARNDKGMKSQAGHPRDRFNASELVPLDGNGSQCVAFLPDTLNLSTVLQAGLVEVDADAGDAVDRSCENRAVFPFVRRYPNAVSPESQGFVRPTRSEASTTFHAKDAANLFDFDGVVAGDVECVVVLASGVALRARAAEDLKEMLKGLAEERPVQKESVAAAVQQAGRACVGGVTQKKTEMGVRSVPRMPDVFAAALQPAPRPSTQPSDTPSDRPLFPPPSPAPTNAHHPKADNHPPPPSLGALLVSISTPDTPFEEPVNSTGSCTPSPASYPEDTAYAGTSKAPRAYEYSTRSGAKPKRSALANPQGNRPSHQCPSTLAVTIHDASDMLPCGDTEAFRIAYAKVIMGGDCYATRLSSGSNPRWEETFRFPKRQPGQVLKVVVYTKRRIERHDDFAGELLLNTAHFFEKEDECHGTYTLGPRATGRQATADLVLLKSVSRSDFGSLKLSWAVETGPVLSSCEQGTPSAFQGNSVKLGCAVEPSPKVVAACLSINSRTLYERLVMRIQEYRAAQNKPVVFRGVTENLRFSLHTLVKQYKLQVVFSQVGTSETDEETGEPCCSLRMTDRLTYFAERGLPHSDRVLVCVVCCEIFSGGSFHACCERRKPGDSSHRTLTKQVWGLEVSQENRGGGVPRFTTFVI
ncbi:hypothetical protein DIPPA_25871 [Diplonema papillatum]|nr:hypothetical protein DIPPA_25871 [Diplonema papillatum]